METGRASTGSFVNRHAAGLLVAACILGYVVLACLIYWPATPWNDSRLPSFPWGGYGYGDPAQMSWYLGWTPHALLHGLNPLHTNLIDYPTGANLASNTSSPLLGVLAAPVSLTLGPVAAFNVMVRLAFAASATAMMLVLRTWCRWWVAAVGGLFYGFGPYVVTQSTHLNLAFVPLLPAIVWVLHDLVSAHRHGARAMGIWLGGLLGAQVLIDPELLALLAAVVVPGLVALAVVDRHHLRERFSTLLRALPYTVVVVVVLNGFFVWWMLAGPLHVNGPPLPVWSLQNYRTDIMGPVVPTLNQLVLPRSLVTVASRFSAGNFSENDGYLGIGFIVWVVVVAVLFRRHRVVRYSALGALAALVLSFGSRLTFNAHVTSIPLPEAILYHLPLFDRIVPSRFAVVVILFAVFAGAVGAEDYVSTRGADRSRREKVSDMSMAGVALVAVVLAVPQVALVTKAPNWPSGVQSALKVVPDGGVVLTYPYLMGFSTEALSWQAQGHFRFKLIGGYANIPGPYRHGQAFAYSLSPTSVQSFLVASLGAPNPYDPTVTTGSQASDLCVFVRRYHVAAIAWWKQGAHPVRVREWFQSDFGRPAASTGHGTFAVWLTTPDHCGSRAAPGAS